MDASEAVQFAITYLSNGNVSAEEIRLNRELQYLICCAVDRLERTFAEVTKKDIALVIESWLAAQGTLKPKTPLEYA